MFNARLFSLLLILLLGLSTVGFGVARGQASTAGQVVICTGQGIVTISVDAEGNPVETHTLCPDAALVSLAAIVAAPAVITPIDVSLVWLDWPQDAQLSRVSSPLTRGARGPPV